MFATGHIPGIPGEFSGGSVVYIDEITNAVLSVLPIGTPYKALIEDGIHLAEDLLQSPQGQGVALSESGAKAQADANKTQPLEGNK